MLRKSTSTHLIIGLLALCILQSACVSLRSVSLTSIPSKRKNEIRAEASKMVILGFNFDNDFVDSVADDLKSQCPGGLVKGLLTKDETVMYFLFFVYKYQVTASGYCIRGDEKVARQDAAEPSTLGAF